MCTSHACFILNVRRWYLIAAETHPVSAGVRRSPIQGWAIPAIWPCTASAGAYLGTVCVPAAADGQLLAWGEPARTGLEVSTLKQAVATRRTWNRQTCVVDIWLQSKV